MPGELELLFYTEGARTPFLDWLSSLHHLPTVALIRARLNRLRLGNFGDCKSVGAGVYELRIDFGPGFRIYFGRKRQNVVNLLCGGDKKSQTRDIRNAQRYWKDFLHAQNTA